MGITTTLLQNLLIEKKFFLMLSDPYQQASAKC